MNANINISAQYMMQQEQTQKLHMKLEDLRLRLNEPIVPLTNDAILHLSTELQPFYKALIMYNLDEFITRNLETALWNDCFKTPLTRYGRTDKNLFNLMIENGVGFYLGLIQDIGVHFDISFITNVPSATKLFCTPTSMMNGYFLKPSKSSIYFIIQNCLLHVGDLLRYRGTSYPEAIKMYEKSAAVCPSNGYPYHQMGLTQLLLVATMGEDETFMDGLLSCLYYFARSLSVSNQYLPGFQSIENLVKTKVEVVNPTKLSVSQEVMQLFMLSIYGNSTSANLSSLMSQVVSSQQLNSSTFMKMIVVSLWNNWRNQFSSNSLEIIACIFNSVVLAVTSALAEFPKNLVYSLPHLKILMEWMNWHQDNPAMPSLYSKLNVGALVSVLAKLQANHQYAQNTPNSWIMEAILPEEKKLIGFIPLDYSSCFNAGSSAGAIEPLNNGSNANNPSRRSLMSGHLLSEDKDVSIAFNLRIHRIISVALKLAANRNCFLFDGSKFVEKLVSPSSANAVPTPVQPSRRNVALQSIFRTANSNRILDNQVDNQQHQESVSPSFCGSSYLTSSDSNNSANSLNNFYQPFGGTTPTMSGSSSNLGTTHDFFRSIWSPDAQPTETNWN